MKRNRVVVAVAVAVVAGAVAGWSVAGDHVSRAAVPFDVAGVTQTTTVTTSQLVHGTWAALPPAPIAARMEPAAVWTGSELFVWSGAPQGGPWRDNGATYNPTTRTWSMLPQSPLSVRRQAATVMAGKQVFIWGGSKEPSQSTRLHDGALYDPGSKTWTMLPPGPTEAYQSAQALWTGKQVVLLTAVTFAGGDIAAPPVIHAHAFDPTTRRWTSLPDLTMQTGQSDLFFSAVSTGSQIWVFPHWQRSLTNGDNAMGTTAGVSTYVYDLADGTWSSRSVIPTQSGTAANPVWTGSDVLIPEQTIWCGMCSPPSQPSRPGWTIDVATGTAQHIPAVYPTTGNVMVPHVGMQYVWTGGDLLGYNSDAAVTGRGITHHPGEASVWEPGASVWQKLPSAPVAGSQPVSVWTGSRLLIWGEMYSPMHPGAGSTTGGIEFVPQS